MLCKPYCGWRNVGRAWHHLLLLSKNGQRGGVWMDFKRRQIKASYLSMPYFKKAKANKLILTKRSELCHPLRMQYKQQYGLPRLLDCVHVFKFSLWLNSTLPFNSMSTKFWSFFSLFISCLRRQQVKFLSYSVTKEYVPTPDSSNTVDA